MAQVTSVTSESLQSQFRRLLPSQQGFGEDLQASNVILPIIDLTNAAEGSTVPQQLQEAQAFGSQTAFNVSNSTSTIANASGFYKIQCIVNFTYSSATGSVNFNITDGLSTKLLYSFTDNFSITSTGVSYPFDFIVFLRPNDELSVTSSFVQGNAIGSIRQIADVNGNLVNPVGFSPQ